MSPRIAAVASFFVAMLGSVPTVNGWEENQTLERFAGEDARSRGRTSVRRITEDDSAAISKLIDDINAAARTNKQRMLSIITINTDVAGSTLEQEKAKYGLSFGEVYVAHSLALATRTKFDTIVKLEKSGKTWPQIAREHNVTLKGSRELIRQMKEKK